MSAVNVVVAVTVVVAAVTGAFTVAVAVTVVVVVATGAFTVAVAVSFIMTIQQRKHGSFIATLISFLKQVRPKSRESRQNTKHPREIIFVNG
jgi:hypothetical protein